MLPGAGGVGRPNSKGADTAFRGVDLGKQS